MNCKKIKKLIYGIFDKEAAINEKNTVEKHIDSCNSCKEIYEKVRNMRNAMESIPKSEAPEGFTYRLKKKIETIENKKRINIVVPTLSFALGAAVILIVLLFKSNMSTPVRYISPDNMAKLASYTRGTMLFEGSTSYLKLDIRSRKDLEDVSIRITLPSGLVLSNNSNKAKWYGDLKKGLNIILLTVKGKAEGIWDIEGVLEKNGLKKTFTQEVKVI
ncbi:anti-sigma factor family protein [Elusimicrobiota bacterium]